jgi:hypothetical protein
MPKLMDLKLSDLGQFTGTEQWYKFGLTNTAGCHVISSEEIDKFAPVLDAVQVPIPVVEGDTE